MLVLIAGFVAILVGCVGGVAGTPVPPGYPLNPCPATGPDAVTPRGSHLVAIGEVSIGWLVWHNETPANFACGAQSVDGAHAVIRLSDLEEEVPIAWAATFRRAVPLEVPAQGSPLLELFRVTEDGWHTIERIEVPLEQQYGALGYLSPGLDVGSYRVVILAPSGEMLAEGAFEIVE